MKNKIIVFAVYIFCSSPLTAQTWQWALSKGNNSTKVERGAGVLVAPNGHVYCVGSFTGNITLDSFYTSAADGKGFIADFTPDGIPVNAMIYDDVNQGTTWYAGFSCDHRGNIYLIGSFDGTYSFDGVIKSMAHGQVVSFDSTLSFRFSKRVLDEPYSVAFDDADDMYVCGEVYRPNTIIDTFVLHNPDGFSDSKMFVAKLDATPYCQWAKQGTNGNSGLRQCKISKGNVYVYGYIDTCTTFDTSTICGFSNYVFKVQHTGSIAWYVNYSFLNHAFYTSISVDDFGNCFILGGYDSTMYIGGDTLNKTPGSNYNGFLAKCDSNGNFIWIKQFVSDENVYSELSSTSKDGYTYILGKFSGTAQWGGETLTATGNEEMFIARYSPGGTCVGAIKIPTANYYSIAEDVEGNLYVTGSILPGNTTFGATTLTSAGGEDFFLAKLSAVTSSALTLPENNLLSIYPNPNASNFIVKIPEELNATRIQLSVYNNMGKIIKEERMDVEGNKLWVELGEITTGIYNIVLTSGQKKYTGRVVVK